MLSPQPYLEKVTGFVTRVSPLGVGSLDLLLFRHPHAGIQIPAGTVEEGETLEAAALREVLEETGLSGLRLIRHIGWRDELPPGALENRPVTHVICRGTTLYSRPDPTSFDFARLPRGFGVCLERTSGDYAQVTYFEVDSYPDRREVTYQLTGWVPLDALAITNRRHFFHLHAPNPTPDNWEQFSDNHRFACFWSPLTALPAIVYPQNLWLDFVRVELGYSFE